MKQLVLLYVSEIWVVTGDILKVWEGFHHQAARRITSMMALRGAGREWEYPQVVAEIEDRELHPIGEYTRRQQMTIAEKVACHYIYGIRFKAGRMLGTIWMVRW